ncbi:MAG: acyltransferase family protein [Bacteroidales bacterium]
MQRQRVSSPLTLESKKHYPILDGLRGVAAILVVWYHLFEGYATSRFDQIFNHGYLAVDFFYLLSGFVIAYAYDNRWTSMRLNDFSLRRFIRLQPMVLVGAFLGGLLFYAQGCEWWDVSKISMLSLFLAMLMHFLMLPTTPQFDVRGLGEAYPLNGPAWSLFFEYIGNLFYALFIRRFSTRTLIVWTLLLGLLLSVLVIFGSQGDLSYGWKFNEIHFPAGLVRMLFPFSMGLLMFRILRAGTIKGAFLFGSILLISALSVPRIGSELTLWANGLYEILVVSLLFPTIVYMGISGTVKGIGLKKLCDFLGDISYPLYILHYPFIYLYISWIKNNNLPFTKSWYGAFGVLFISILTAYFFTRFYDLPLRKYLTKALKKIF